MSKLWLISYWNNGSMHETTHKGTLGEWRIEQLEFKDGPYILVSAHRLSEKEFKRLDGWIG